VLTAIGAKDLKYRHKRSQAVFYRSPGGLTIIAIAARKGALMRCPRRVRFIRESGHWPASNECLV